MCTKKLFQKLEKRKNADQTILFLKRKQNCKILKDQQEKLTAVKTFYKQLYGQKNNLQGRTEINPSPSGIGRNHQHHLNKSNFKYVNSGF